MDWKKLLFSFEGRISRKAYWIAVVAMIVVTVILQTVALAPIMAAAASGDAAAMANVSTPLWLWIVMLPMLWISLAIYAKRWHDIDKSGWFTLLMIIPFVGLIVLIVLGCLAGTPGPNRFGEGPMA